jgi:hypothetical protein
MNEVDYKSIVTHFVLKAKEDLTATFHDALLEFGNAITSIQLV